MNSIDDLLRRSLTAPVRDAVEASSLARTRAALDLVIGTEPAPIRRRVWRRKLQVGVGLLPAAAVGLLVVVISVGAVLFIHGRPRTRSAISDPPTATALIGRLSVLARPQTGADRLPDRVTNHWAQLTHETQAGRLFPRLTRLVLSQGKVKLYLAVVAPSTDPYSPWTPEDGDQVTVIEVGPTGTSATQAIPAKALSDADIVSLIAPPGPFREAVGTGTAFALSIVPDSVARTSWFYSAKGYDTRINVPVHNNLAITGAGSRYPTGKVDATWYTDSGKPIRTNNSLIEEAQAASQRRRYRQDLQIAKAQKHSAAAEILKAFAVFSFDRPAGTRLPDGLIISKPPLDQLPLGVLSFAEATPGRRFALDLRDVRRVQAPSGLSMYILPGTSGLCVAQTGVFEIRDSPAQAAGAGFGCTQKLSSALLHGSGIISGTARHQTDYGIVPRAHPITTVSLKGGRSRTLRPSDGVYIERS
jgi:hypothetical protein